MNTIERAAPVDRTKARERRARLTLALAALYNAACAVWTVMWPESFFDLMALPQPTYPALWQCIGMMVGVFGLGYAYAAWRIDRATPFVALGLLGKLFGPMGWISAVSSGEWPARTFMLVFFNDIIWWIPFTLTLACVIRYEFRRRV
ncbi:MAG: alkyl hydroperoxide reductase [SAR202 cluster bacterium]|nr:alkyl hydroperoxide reductase [SAR202 cluster bacterium]